MQEESLVTTFQDLFKKSALELFPNQIEPFTLILTLVIAFLVGMGIFWVYRKCFIGVVYDHALNLSLVIMTLLVAVIIVTISTNITLSLGMVGALSIVRYRTAVKNPLDLMFLFWAITSGIAIGAQYYYIAFVAWIVVTLALVFLKRLKGNAGTYVLIVTYRSAPEVEEAVRRCLHDQPGKFRSKVVKGGTTELTMELYLKTDNLNVTQPVQNIEGVQDVTLVEYRGNLEA